MNYNFDTDWLDSEYENLTHADDNILEHNTFTNLFPPSHRRCQECGTIFDLNNPEDEAQ
jgi:hypothetical protein